MFKEFYKEIYEEFEDCFGKFNDDRRLFGFWEALGWDIHGTYNRRVGWWVRKIIKIVYWIPVLWHDEDWENTYILKLLRYKLTRVKKEIIRGFGDDKQWKEPRSAEIDSAIESIDKILKDEFVEEEREAHKIKYGEIAWLSGPEKIINGNKLHEMIIYYDKVKDDAELKEKASQESSNIHNLEDKRRQEEYNKLFEGLAKNIQGWWD